jgi:hypothetical protein
VNVPRGVAPTTSHDGHGSGMLYRSAGGNRDAALVYIESSGYLRVHVESTSATTGATSCVVAFIAQYTVEGDY